jgi:hypothetical protein
VSPIRDEPLSIVDRLAQVAADEIEEQAKLWEVEVKHLVVMLRIAGQPRGEENSTTAGFNVEDASDAFATALAHVTQAGKEMGLTVKVIPFPKEGQG